MGRALLASGDLGQHNGLPAAIIVSAALDDAAFEHIAAALPAAERRRIELHPPGLGERHLHPRVRVVLLIEDWQTLRQRLLDDAVELFVADIRELQGDPQLRIHPLREHPGVLFCRPGHPLLRLVRPSAEQLADYPLAGPRLPEAVRGDLARLLQREEPLGIQCDDVLMLKGLVGSSELISLAPWDVVAADVEAGRLALLPWPAGAEPARAKGSAYGLVSRAGRSLSPAAAVFVERVLEQDRRFAAT